MARRDPHPRHRNRKPRARSVCPCLLRTFPRRDDGDDRHDGRGDATFLRRPVRQLAHAAVRKRFRRLPRARRQRQARRPEFHVSDAPFAVAAAACAALAGPDVRRFPGADAARGVAAVMVCPRHASARDHRALRALRRVSHPAVRRGDAGRLRRGGPCCGAGLERVPRASFPVAPVCH